jgi:phage tail-like protein
LDPAGADEAIEFQVVQAFPVKWVGPDLSASQNNLAVETIELAHQGFRRTR